ncbi:hypothetical protein GCK72_024950 [Caenorhabditis remanei]|uniref:Serpentine receptor class r-10 n=1 Tax=Caenorhabditis remanei TaxID=31234 RepID=A0A6A5G107_CAERE|nr:hypothetical protein GCK72_024950 [Caenorhabditis remanei]KAF1748483.1 hypothetical protein GCK72_024950 [Caenorhabditis remanei]
MNSVLLFLLYYRANPKFGRYRILMIVFSLSALWYSIIEVLTLPVMFSKGRSLCVCSNGPLRLYRPIGVPLTGIYCGSFGLCISLLALHFFYRYIAVCKSEKMYYFDGNRIYITFLPCVVVFIAWSLTTYYPMAPDEMRERHYHDVLMEHFNTNSHESSFLAMMFKAPATHTQPEHWIPTQLLACAFMSSIMGTCFSVIVYCGLKSFQQMKNCASHMSTRTRELNRQLFTTLAVQTVLPVVTMYLPVGLIMILPIFGVELGVAANKTAAFLGLYPALDPLIAILMIKDFRNFIFCKSTLGASIASHSAPPSKLVQATQNQNQ